MFSSHDAHTISRRGFLKLSLSTVGALGGLTLVAACTQPSSPGGPGGQPAPGAAPAKVSTKDVTFTYWNGLTGADGPIMDELIERFTAATSIKVEQQRIPWADLYPKLQISTPAGEGPDLCLMHTAEIPHFAEDGILEEMDEKVLTDRGFKAEDYVDAPWQGGTYKGKRYAIPLDIPQYVLYLNNPLLKDAGLANADGSVKVPTNKDELVSMAKAITKGDVYGLVLAATNGIGLAWGFHNLLWQNETNVFQSDLKKSAVAEPPAIEAAEFLGGLHSVERVAPPPGTVSLDAFVAGKLGMWVGGTWNIVGLRAQRADFTAAPMPKIFKKQAVWTTPHQFTFPKPKSRNDARREAAMEHIRWVTDNVTDWTTRAGQVSPLKKVQQDPKIASDPSLKVFLDQAPNWTVAQPSVNWTRAEQLMPPQLEAVYLGQKPAADAMRELARQIDAL